MLDLGLALNFSEKIAANKVKVMYQMIPITANVKPKIRNGIGSLIALGLINCGNKAKKNNATLGFNRLVKNPDQKSLFLMF